MNRHLQTPVKTKFSVLIYSNIFVVTINIYFRNMYVCCVKYWYLRANEYIRVITVGNYVNAYFFVHDFDIEHLK
jgi:hypothetical protein